ncbi:hypothetical protein BDU57DRAFT_517291 [Ampelomyces quisqualis]|uniref:Uncharacterized protein n=1 Tax=Ampelomyces quisqualis TaxID=50730 RepID=A0A6A5QSG5_AMPQU|nr:hypothetical protein BDU57DRAFT_517291 [Ampelomyces quisqualis]
MDSLFPQAAYAEDQRDSKSILYLHVMRASTMSFTFFSLFRFPFAMARAHYRKTPVDLPVLVARTLQSSGRAFALGSVVGALATWGRMRGKEEIEWQDRAWRILGNKGEMKTDWVTVGGVGAGAIASIVAARRGVVPISVGTAVLGGAGAGSGIGIPFMISTFATGRKPA